MLSDQIVLKEDMDGTARLTLNRPKAGNSLSIELLDALAEEIEAQVQRSDISTIILAGQGHIFCAGHDLKEMTAARGQPDGGKSFFETTFARCAHLMTSIVRCPKPVIAEVNGLATAAGSQLVASCDLAIASETATFATPGVNIGLFCSTPMVALSRNMHRKAAMEMLLTGEPIDAIKAQSVGLVNSVVPADRLKSETENLAAKIAKKSSRVVKIGKEAFYNQLEMPLDDAYQYTSAVMVANMLDGEAVEGINAFIEKRQPSFKT